MTTESRFDILVHRSRIGQFVSVGAIGAAIETAIVAILTAIFGTGPIMAKAIGAEISISTMFTINDRWTFADQGAVGWLAVVRRWCKSHLVRIVGLAISFTTLYFLTSGVSFSLTIVNVELWPTVANAIGICVGMIVNYVAESLFTWQIT